MDDESFRARVHKVFGCLSPSASVWSLSDEDVEKKEWNRSALKQGKDDDDHNLCSSSYDELFKKKCRNIQNVINDDENGVDDVWEIRSSIGLDSTLDNETTSQEKDTMKEILAMMTNLCQKIEKMETDVQVLKEKVNSQQHDSKYAELSQQHDLKNAELEGDDGKHLKTQNKKIYTSAGSSATAGSTSTTGPSTKKEETKEEEDEYDRVAEGREDAGDRLYMKNIIDQETSCDPPEYNIRRDPRANHMAAQVRLKEDADAAEKCETDFDGITLSGGQHSAKSLQDHCDVKPILKKARKSVNGELKSTKRVRFDPGCKDGSDGASEVKVSWAAPASANSTSEGNESISSRLKIPDYVLNPSYYTCYSLDSPSELIDEPSQAFGYVLEEVEKSKDDVLEQQTIDTSDTNPKSVVFVPRQKNMDAITGASLSKGIIEDACNESLHPKGFPVCIAAGEAQQIEDPMEEDMEARVAENNIVTLKPERRYRIKAGMEDS